MSLQQSSVEANAAPKYWNRRLSTLACRAALELNDIILRRDESLEAVHALIERLRALLARTPVTGGEPLLGFDPSMAIALTRALSDSRIATEPPLTVDDLALKIGELLDRVFPPGSAEITPDSLKDFLPKFRDFCLDLSDYASAHDQSTYHWEQEKVHRG